jgi:hypothetical protein
MVSTPELPEKGKNRASVHYPVDIVVPPHDHDRHSPPQSVASSVAGTDDEDDEEYDWSDEEDLVDQEAKFEERMGNAPKRTGWGFKR